MAMDPHPQFASAPAPTVGFDEGVQALGGLPGMLPGLSGNAVPAPRQALTPSPAPASPSPPPKPPATETLAQRTGNLINEVDFPGFVAQLVNGTFDAIVDASIRQMESYAELVAAVAKTTEQFTEENVSANQARDWVAQQYGADVAVLLPRGSDDQLRQPMLVPRGEGHSPAWLANYGVGDQELSSELLESVVLPQARAQLGRERQQLLATLVMMGLNRVAVKDGSISAKVMFRAVANDKATVQYAQGADPGSATGSSWGSRGSLAASSGVSTMVSTLNLNAQSDTSLSATMFGEVKLNFVSETLPLDKMADAMKLAMVQRHAALGPRAAAPLPAATPVAPAVPAAPTEPGRS
ncbi:hypothetical protein [Pelomonas sp. BJYL3]|uniref:hypothetical protein n=1 Tax=Pelomonas sp. BJYL3 TaxID=2976697 RepID=UPI0022B5C320|nr:hypothetical protein [Pelomonas sp. BJYL3]